LTIMGVLHKGPKVKISKRKERGTREQWRVQHQVLQWKCCKGCVRIEIRLKKRRKSIAKKSLPAKMKKSICRKRCSKFR
jgi:hypothetical protein